MSFKKELFRKLTATLLVMGLLAVMLYFSVILVTSSNVFDPMLKTILTVCTGLLCLAALYFFYCKIYETVMLIKSANVARKNSLSTAKNASPENSAASAYRASTGKSDGGAFHEEEYEDDDEIEQHVNDEPSARAKAPATQPKSKAKPGKKR